MKPDYGKLTASILVGGYLLNAALNPTAPHFIDNANLMFHEAGHLLFGLFPEWIAIAMGSGFQTLVPLAIMLAAIYRRQYHMAAVVLIWVGQTLTNTSVYAGDALNMQLQLIGGPSTTHDWNHLLWHFGLLRHTDTIAAIFRTTGIIMVLSGLILALYLSFEWSENKFDAKPSKQ